MCPSVDAKVSQIRSSCSVVVDSTVVPLGPRLGISKPNSNSYRTVSFYSDFKHLNRFTVRYLAFRFVDSLLQPLPAGAVGACLFPAVEGPAGPALDCATMRAVSVWHERDEMTECMRLSLAHAAQPAYIHLARGDETCTVPFKDTVIKAYGAGTRTRQLSIPLLTDMKRDYQRFR